jgi:N-acetylmuramoyl-L-alanine amidase
MTKIYIDAGHGGTETGTSGTYKGITYLEKNINLQIALQVKKFLATVNPAPVVYMSRQTDITKGTCTRGSDAKSKGVDVFVSIHNNSNGSSANGTLTLYPKDFTAGHEQSKQFATLMQTTLVNWLNKQNWKVKNDGISVWTNSTAELGVFRCSAPTNACLVEVDFMSSQSDMAKLVNPKFIEDAGYGIALGIITWLNQSKGINLSNPIKSPIKSTPSTTKFTSFLGFLFILALLGGASYYIIKRGVK